MGQATVSVRGYRDLHRALARAEKQVRADVREVMRDVARPVASAAEELALVNIRNIGSRWPVMRIGVTQKALYVVPKQRGGRGSKRPNLARLLSERSLQPAEDKYAGTFEREVEQALDKIADKFNRGI